MSPKAIEIKIMTKDFGNDKKEILFFLIPASNRADYSLRMKGCFIF